MRHGQFVRVAYAPQMWWIRYNGDRPPRPRPSLPGAPDEGDERLGDEPQRVRLGERDRSFDALAAALSEQSEAAARRDVGQCRRATAGVARLADRAQQRRAD